MNISDINLINKTLNEYADICKCKREEYKKNLIHKYQTNKFVKLLDEKEQSEYFSLKKQEYQALQAYKAFNENDW